MTSATRPALAATGFHPLDGGGYLRDVQGADEVLCRLVANHSCAIIEARQRGLSNDLANEFQRVDPALEDALTYCDMTTKPDGLPVCVQSRLSEIVKRYGPFEVVTRFITKAKPHLIASVEEFPGARPRQSPRMYCIAADSRSAELCNPSWETRELHRTVLARPATEGERSEKPPAAHTRT